MSLLTASVIHAMYVGDRALLDRLGARVSADDHREQKHNLLDEDKAGGTKVFCGHVFAAEFNYLSPYELEEWFVGLPWGSCDNAVLSAEGEDHSVVVTILAGKPVTIARFDAGSPYSGREVTVELLGTLDEITPAVGSGASGGGASA